MTTVDEAGDAEQDGTEQERAEQERAEQDGAEQDGAQQDGGKRAGILPLLIVGLVGLGGGGALGGRALGPRVGEELARRQLEGGRDSNGGEHGSDEETALHIIDNLVVNPAQSGGTRFLLTSVAIQLVSPDHTDLLLAQDVELRDALIMVLGTKTVEELTDITLRRGIVGEILQALEYITGPEIIHRVFLPQFVIQ